jgi:hypothetical protein
MLWKATAADRLRKAMACPGIGFNASAWFFAVPSMSLPGTKSPAAFKKTDIQIE